LPYEVFVISGLVIWNYLASGVTGAANSVVANSPLVVKVYFPRLAIPLAAILSGLADLAVAMAFMVSVLIYFGADFSLRMLIWAPLILVTVAAAAGVGFALSGLNVLYRDIRHLVPFLVQAWFFATPVVYPFDLFPEAVQPVLALNPMVGVVEGFRWSVGADTAPWTAIAVSSLSALVLLVLGSSVFTAAERRFADVI